MKIEYALAVYFAVNLFMAGYAYADYQLYDGNRREIILGILKTAVIALFGSMLLCVVIMMAVCKHIITATQDNFWIQFYFTCKWDKLSEGQLKQINAVFPIKPNAKTFSERMQRRCTRAINKRNGYV